jgi:hypothetical protein
MKTLTGIKLISLLRFNGNESPQVFFCSLHSGFQIFSPAPSPTGSRSVFRMLNITAQTFFSDSQSCSESVGWLAGRSGAPEGVPAQLQEDRLDVEKSCCWRTSTRQRLATCW